MTGAADDSGVAAAVSAAYSAEWARIVATLIRVTGNWSLAEECAQDAFEIALDRWVRDGIPPNPGGWLTVVAKNRAIDRLRRSATETTRLRDRAILDELERADPEEIEDDRLRLLFTCCHPALTLEARVALTLRTVAGLTTTEIATAFLVPEATMAQRLVRAKAKIRNAGIPYRVPPAELLGERLPGVLAVLYLLFTEGYSATTGAEVVRKPLAEEAIRVTDLLAKLMPDEPEVSGLLALLQLQHARRAGRVDEAGDIIPLEEQVRENWAADEIARGLATLQSARPTDPGPYRLQAEIAAAHATAPSWDETDFSRIVDAYDALAARDSSPIVAFNRALAIAMRSGPEAGLAEIDAVAARLPGYRMLPAARADLLRRLGRAAESAAEYRAALALAPPDAERRFLERRLAAALAATGSAPKAATF